MKVTVFGMGYVGCVTAACLANQGHDVIGVDLDQHKTGLINQGRSPIIEPDLEAVIKRAVSAGKLRAVTEISVLGDICLICVGTPSNDNGSLNLEQVLRVAAHIGDLIANSESYHVVNVRSTVLPGTVANVVIPSLESRSAKKAGRDFGVCMNPEFIRESTAVRDFYNPPFTIIGALDLRSANTAAELYSKLDAPIEMTGIMAAEMTKYACNAFHALKICFANEIGTLCKSFGVDSHAVMDLVCKDKKLNLSHAYLKPGSAFGGSCLPKDLRAILYKGRQQDLELPVLNSLLLSNQKHLDRAYAMIKKTGKSRVGVLGLSFKAGTDDLRESPTVALIETLIGKGFTVSIYDEEVSLANLLGANRRFIEQTIPHFSSLMSASIRDVIGNSDVVVVSKKNKQFRDELINLNGDKVVVDLVRTFPDLEKTPSNYEGICW
jgi:GDP-mannose 6-dehydrogenase